MTTAYHPQGDGQIEVVNHVLQQYLCAFVYHQPSQWASYYIGLDGTIIQHTKHQRNDTLSGGICETTTFLTSVHYWIWYS